MSNREIARILMNYYRVIRELRTIAANIAERLINNPTLLRQGVDHPNVAKKVSVRSWNGKRAILFRIATGEEFRFGPEYPTFDIRVMLHFVQTCLQYFPQALGDQTDHYKVDSFLSSYTNNCSEVVNMAHQVAESILLDWREGDLRSPSPGSYIISTSQGGKLCYDNGLQSFNRGQHKVFGGENPCNDYRFAADFLREHLQWRVANGIDG